MAVESDTRHRPARRKFLTRALKALALVVGGATSMGVPAAINRVLDAQPVEPDITSSVSNAPKTPDHLDGKEVTPWLEVPVVRSGAAETGENRHVSGSLLGPMKPEDQTNGGKINPVDGKVYVDR